MTVGLTSVAGIVNQMVSAIGVCEKIFEIMDAPVEVVNGTYVYDGSYKNGGTIQFTNVSFSYPTKKDVKVLKNINLSIYNGESLALVGSSGSGKSSIVSLILRFYDIETGSLTYDGTELK
jgi:ABC-type multidrug transport system fused ATPase/permease subunit